LSRHVEEALVLADRAARDENALIDEKHLVLGVLRTECHTVDDLASLGLTQVHVVEHLSATTSSAAGPRTDAVPGPRPVLLPGAAADTTPLPGDGRVKKADRLDAATDVEMLVSVLIAKDTPRPLAVGLFGDWGSGKSFFMALMQERMCELADLARAGAPEGKPYCSRVLPVRFNAWHYVDTNLWASLATTLFDDLAKAAEPTEAQPSESDLEAAKDAVTATRAERERLEHDVVDLERKAGRAGDVVRTSFVEAARRLRDDENLAQELEACGNAPVKVHDLVTAFDETRSVGDRLLGTLRLGYDELARHGRRRAGWLTLVVAVLLFVVVAVLLRWSVTAQVLGLLAAAGAVVAPLQRAAAPLLDAIRTAREAREGSLIEAKAALEAAKAEEAAAEAAEKKAAAELADQLDPGRRLQKYVRERAASEDYRSQLGVISTVRRDLEKLVELMAAPPPADAPMHLPEFDRVVLFIDDLDRCPDDKVVDVLQAVHLLLAFDLFMVVVGVDGRWLEHALGAKYAQLRDEPQRYLEKIFQIPFTIRPMQTSGYRDLVGDVLSGVRTHGTGTSWGKGSHLPVQPAHEATTPMPQQTRTGGEDDASGEPTTHHKDTTPPEPDHEPPAPAPVPPRPEALTLTSKERDLLAELAGLVPTPRATKRLVNTYRMLRVGVPDDELEAFLPDGGSEYQALVLLVGILAGAPGAAQEVFDAVLATSEVNDVRVVLARFPWLCRALGDLMAHLTVVRPDVYQRWTPRVRRFSFHRAVTRQPLAQASEVLSPALTPGAAPTQ
jgi:hypothetical protein